MEVTEEVRIEIRDIIRTDKNLFRVIGMKENTISLIQINSGKITIILQDAKVLIGMVRSGEVVVEHPRMPSPITVENRSQIIKNNFADKKAIVSKIEKDFGPLYDKLIVRGRRNPTIDSILSDYSYKRTHVWLIIRQWLQSGFDDNVLIDHRNNTRNTLEYSVKTGRPRSDNRNSEKTINAGIPLTDDVRAIFEIGRKRLLSGRENTIHSVFKSLLNDYYSKFETDGSRTTSEYVAIDQRPTEDQFRYYISKNVSDQEMDCIKTSERENRNDKRPLLSDSLEGVRGPMDIVEIDACELDVSLVAKEDRSVTVGRPILYVMIDVFTRMIIAYAVGFENNSVRGLTNCLLSLADDKIIKCRQLGVQMKPGSWPFGYLPYTIRSDYGSEFKSNEFTRICRELNIIKEMVPPATGSLKPLVEQCFHQLHSKQNPNLGKKGLIEKRYDSTHHKDAILNIDEMEKIIISSIAVHNNHYMEKYPLLDFLREMNISPRPIEIWESGIKTFGSPRLITNTDMFRYSLLLPVHASIDRTGISFNDLSYINFADDTLYEQMFKAGKHHIPLETARIDERSIDKLYYLQGSRIMTAPLNPRKAQNSGYSSLSLAEYNKLRKKKRQLDTAGRDENLLMDAALQQHHKEIIDNAKREANEKAPGANKTKNLRAQRAAEKKRREQEELVMRGIEEENHADSTIQTQIGKQDGTASTGNSIITITLEEAMDSLNDQVWGDLDD